jgi:hypothetical protein
MDIFPREVFNFGHPEYVLVSNIKDLIIERDWFIYNMVRNELTKIPLKFVNIETSKKSLLLISQDTKDAFVRVDDNFLCIVLYHHEYNAHRFIAHSYDLSQTKLEPLTTIFKFDAEYDEFKVKNIYTKYMITFSTDYKSKCSQTVLLDIRNLSYITFPDYNICKYNLNIDGFIFLKSNHLDKFHIYNIQTKESQIFEHKVKDVKVLGKNKNYVVVLPDLKKIISFGIHTEKSIAFNVKIDATEILVGATLNHYEYFSTLDKSHLTTKITELKQLFDIIRDGINDEKYVKLTYRFINETIIEVELIVDFNYFKDCIKFTMLRKPVDEIDIAKFLIKDLEERITNLEKKNC